MPSLLPIVLLTAAVAGHAPVSHARQPQGNRAGRPRHRRARGTGQTPGHDHRQPVVGLDRGHGHRRPQPAGRRRRGDRAGARPPHHRNRPVGRFELRGIPAGTYLLRVQGRGFAASRREFVQVVPSRGTHFDVQLRRAAASVHGAWRRRGAWRPASACRQPRPRPPTAHSGQRAAGRGGRSGRGRAARSLVGRVAPAPRQALRPARDHLAHRRRRRARRRRAVALADPPRRSRRLDGSASAARPPPPC